MLANGQRFWGQRFCAGTERGAVAHRGVSRGRPHQPTRARAQGPRRCAHAAHIYEKTGNLRAVQLLLGHKQLESTSGGLPIRNTIRKRSDYAEPHQGG